MKIILKQLSKIYSAMMAVRGYLYARKFFNSYKSSLPVICVGNISAGGTGKTPLVIFLAKALKEKNFMPVILSRGYGGKFKGVHEVKTSDDPKLCGDEPLLMANAAACPVVVARKRAEGAKYIEEKKLGNLILLDDGLQHLSIVRDINIVTINIGNKSDVDDMLENKVLPLGRLREDRDSALSRADFVILSSRMPQARAQTPDRTFLKLIPQNVVIVSSYFEGIEVTSCTESENLENSKEVVAFCGIAKPEGFFACLEGMGYKIKDKIVKRDHYFFSSSELKQMKRKYGDLPLVCTEKDASRINPGDSKGIYKLRGEIRVIPEDAFLVQIRKKLKSL